MHIFHRKSRWQRLSEKVMPGSNKKTPVRTGAAVAAGVAAVTAASAAVSAVRRRTSS